MTRGGMVYGPVVLASRKGKLHARNRPGNSPKLTKKELQAKVEDFVSEGLSYLPALRPLKKRGPRSALSKSGLSRIRVGAGFLDSLVNSIPVVGSYLGKVI